METDELRARFAAGRVAHLATVGAGGEPHLVPVTFAVSADRVVTAVDHKPKRSARLQRIANVRKNPAVCLLVDRYEEDWDRLWWVRADGMAEVVDGGPRHATAVDLLAAKYDQYRGRPPSGPAIVVAVERWSGWQG